MKKIIYQYHGQHKRKDKQCNILLWNRIDYLTLKSCDYKIIFLSLHRKIECYSAYVCKQENMLV